MKEENLLELHIWDGGGGGGGFEAAVLVTLPVLASGSPGDVHMLPTSKKRKKTHKNPYPSQMEASLWSMLPGQGCCGGFGVHWGGGRIWEAVRLGIASQQEGQQLCHEEGGSRAERIFMCERLSGLKR